MRILRVVMEGEEFPHYTISKAFESEFDHVDTVWWTQHEVNGLNGLLQHMVSQNNYDAIFMQIQADHIIYEQTARLMASKTLVFNWTGDVRTDLTAYTRIGEHCITLFSNDTDTKRMREMGYRSEYLQVGYDHHWYNISNQSIIREPFIVFCANNYPNHSFPLSHQRIEVARRLNLEFGSRFRLYGKGWEGTGVRVETALNNWMEGLVYKNALLSINLSHFAYERYFSDRLLREMACGSAVLSHRYPRLQEDFIENKHLIVWDDVEQLVAKCHYYLANPDEANLIGEAGARYVTSHCQWQNRMIEFRDIILKYKH